jgi:hypothetical protein
MRWQHSRRGLMGFHLGKRNRNWIRGVGGKSESLLINRAEGRRSHRGGLFALWEGSSGRDSFSQTIAPKGGAPTGGCIYPVGAVFRPRFFFLQSRRRAALPQGVVFTLWERSSDRDSFSQQSRRRAALLQGVIAVILYSVDASQRVPFLYS